MDGFNNNNNNYNDINNDGLNYDRRDRLNNEPANLSFANGYEANAAGGNGDAGKGSDLKSSSFYTESYTKPKKNKNGMLMQLLLVALISSILGGTVTGVFFQFGVPLLKPTINQYLGLRDAEIGTGDAMTSNPEAGTYRKVVIENTSSPVVAIAEKVGSSVVGISVTSRRASDFFFFGSGDSSSEGSGIIIKSDGYIMTNNHVIENALAGTSNDLNQGSRIEVILPNNKDKKYSAKVVGRDARTDLAVLKIDAQNLPVVEFGNSDEVKVGELAVAIGNPGGLEYMGSVTVGVISGLNRTIPIPDGKELNLIQTDASINPGNSGGALVNYEGKLIGVNTAKIGGNGYEGLGFAIPINKVKEITDSLIEFTYVKGRPYLGISTDPRFDEAMAERYNVPMGVLVAEVLPFSGAYKAGIKSNDIITKFDGIAVKTLDELNGLKNQHKPGDIVKVEVYREGPLKGETVTLDVELGEEK
jgi:serine protease Do